jgi:hypothetical protein
VKTGPLAAPPRALRPSRSRVQAGLRSKRSTGARTRRWQGAAGATALACATSPALAGSKTAQSVMARALAASRAGDDISSCSCDGEIAEFMAGIMSFAGTADGAEAAAKDKQAKDKKLE